MIKYILTPLLLVLCTVVCGQGITHYQYWFDGDVDSRVTTATSGNVDVQVDVTALPDGVHTIHYRAVDDQGRWTVRRWLSRRRKASTLAMDGRY